MNVKDIYSQSIMNSQTVFSELISDPECLIEFSKLHNFASDYYDISRIIEVRPESKMLVHAIKVYEHALISISCGHYRQGFISLRLFFELALSCILFSAHEIDYLKWEKNKKDVVWNSIVDPDNGIFAVNFIDPFCEELRSDGKQYKAIAEAVYRECSEYVHGNAHTHSIDMQEIKFCRDLHLEWCQKACSIYNVFIFAFSARYIKYSFEIGKADVLQRITQDSIGHLKGVQFIYENGA